MGRATCICRPQAGEVGVVKCVKCKGPVSPNSRFQLCAPCRMVKCKRHGCQEMVLARTQTTGYCKKHKGDSSRKPDGGMFNI